MDITYKNNKIKKVCTNAKTAEKTYGSDMADKIHQRIDEIKAADTVEMIIKFRIGRCHALTQNRKGEERWQHYGEKSQLYCNATWGDN